MSKSTPHVATIDSSLFGVHVAQSHLGCSRFTRVTSFKIGNSLEDIWNTNCRKFTNTKINIIIDTTSWLVQGSRRLSSSSSWSIPTPVDSRTFTERGNFNRPLFRSGEFCSRGPKGPHVLKEPVYFQSNTIVRILHSSGAHSSGISLEKRNFKPGMQARRSREIIHD